MVVQVRPVRAGALCGVALILACPRPGTRSILEAGSTVSVRPDGRISTPLIEDITAAGKTPTQLAREIEERLKKYIQDPNVTVIVRSFVGPFDRGALQQFLQPAFERFAAQGDRRQRIVNFMRNAAGKGASRS